MKQLWYCEDCGTQIPVDARHSCYEAGQRIAAELLDGYLTSWANPVWQAAASPTGAGLLWLYRIAYRVRSRLNGLEKYKDRAEMARLSCELGGELVK